MKIVQMFKSFPKSAMLKQLIFVLLLFALLFPIAIWDSNTQVKVAFSDTEVSIKTDRYNMSVGYDLIATAELTDLAEPGRDIEDCKDNEIIRTGKWENDVWGEYYINADLDATNCIVLHLTDGRIFVFSCKDNAKTEELYNTLLTHLS